MMSCKINRNREYIHGYCSPCKRFFNSFFLSPLSNCNKLTWQGRRISKRHRHRHCHRHHQTTTNPTTKPSATTKHRNLAQKNIPKSTETQKSTQPKNSTHPPENLAQRSQICRPICCHCCRRVFHCCRRMFHCCRRLEVGGKGSVVEERGRAKVKGRPNRLMAEAAVAAASWE